MTYEIRLYEGDWTKRPTRKNIAACLHCKSFSLDFRLPSDWEKNEGVYRVACISTNGEVFDSETLGDSIFMALLTALEPEYDSMIEIDQFDLLCV